MVYDVSPFMQMAPSALTPGGETLGVHPCGVAVPPVERGHGRGCPLRQLIGRHSSSAGIDAQVLSI